MSNTDGLENSTLECYANIIRQLVDNENTKEESRIIELVKGFRNIYNYSDDDSIKIQDKVIEMMKLHMDVGSMISWEEHKSWYPAKTRNLPMLYTERNLRYLGEYRHLNSEIVTTLDNITNEIMDGFGDPSSGPFKRRGLVIGDVQSGKTNTYTTLCCKAADVGYQVIILLTGTLENLRRQTQERLDEGFVGEDSNLLLKKAGSKTIGVGNINSEVHVAVFTNVESDFKEQTMATMGLRIDAISDSVLLVVKKNKSILTNLYRWLDGKNSQNGIIDKSLLIIDDEADNASINTSSDNITVINGLMRNILKLFTKTTYVGFTATPFANIFIDPESTDEMKGDDLFPKHFIYSLNPASNYIGPTNLFGKGSDYPKMIKTIDDAEKYIPEKHDKDYQITLLPPSLEEAINSFVLSCAIRDIRGDLKKHMSMLVNISRFTNVQEGAKICIENYLFKLKNIIQAFSKLSESKALLCEELKNLKETWNAQYSDCEFKWIDVQYALDSAARSIQVKSINQKNGAKNLNYKDSPDGLRIIAIGGNSLSRGLTLEGLCVSYFYRKSQTYDTLMQMGRWFGYRDGYSDLCRIWMTNNSIEWYEYICTATEELKGEINVMQNTKKTPEEFGLLVRNDVSGLLITGRNKMRSTSDKLIVKSVNGKLIDTEHVFVDPTNVTSNYDAINKMITELKIAGYSYHLNKLTNNLVWNEVPKSYILDLIRNYKNPNSNVIFDTESLINFIDNTDKTELKYWDISIQHGNSKKSTDFNDIHLDNSSIRSKYTLKSNETVIRMIHGQLSSPNNTVEGIYKPKKNNNEYETDEDEKERLEKAYKETHKGKDGKEPGVSVKTYLNTTDRRPLLIIYILDISPSEITPDENDYKKKKEDYDKKINICNNLGKNHLPIGLAVGFPQAAIDPNDPDSEKYIIKYKANAVYSRIGNPDLDEEEIE